MTDPMPVFAIKAKDMLSVAAIAEYQSLCESAGLHDQAREVERALTEICAWQRRHPDQLKLPDHPHVPAESDLQ